MLIFDLFFSRSPASPVSGHESDQLSAPERERRQALEYEEEEVPPDINLLTEAHVAFPNIPVPRSSDGDVSSRAAFKIRHISNITLAIPELGNSYA
jgi:hypothetical protein